MKYTVKQERVLLSVLVGRDGTAYEDRREATEADLRAACEAAGIGARPAFPSDYLRARLAALEPIVKAVISDDAKALVDAVDACPKELLP